MSNTLKEVRHNLDSNWDNTHSRHTRNKLKTVFKKARSTKKQNLKDAALDYLEHEEQFDEEGLHNWERTEQEGV